MDVREYTIDYLEKLKARKIYLLDLQENIPQGLNSIEQILGRLGPLIKEKGWLTDSNTNEQDLPEIRPQITESNKSDCDVSDNNDYSYLSKLIPAEGQLQKDTLQASSNPKYKTLTDIVKRLQGQDNKGVPRNVLIYELVKTGFYDTSLAIHMIKEAEISGEIHELEPGAYIIP